MNDQQSSGGLARTIGPFGLGASVINLIIGSSIFVFPATIAATLVLQRRRIGEDGAPFRLIGGPVIPLAAMGLVVVLATTLERREVGAVGVTVLLAAVTYFASRKAQGAPDHL